MRKFIIAYLAVTAVSGCVGEKGQQPLSLAYDPTASVALNVAQMGGLSGLRDAPAGEAIIQAQADPTGALAAAKIGTYFVQGAAPTPSPGVPSGAAVAFAIADLLMSTPSPDPRLNVRFFSWVPVSLASSKEEAMRRTDRAFEEAFIKRTGLPLIFREGAFKPTFGSERPIRVLATPDCPESYDGHRKWYSAECRANFSANSGFVAGAIDAPAPAPPFLVSAESAWGPIVFTGTLPWSGDEDLWHKFRSSWTLESLSAFSTLLPPWMFIYVPPTTRHPPYVLNEGRQLPFSK